MKTIFNYLIVLFACTACDSDAAWDCVKATGSIQQEEIVLEAFNKIDVRHRVQLIVEQGEEQKVLLETGENLRGKVTLQVIDGELLIKNKNNCNLVRDFGITKVKVTSPNIIQIRNGSGLSVLSEGVLKFPSLALLSEDTAVEGDIHTVGDFELSLEVGNLNIVANGSSNFFLKGTATQATIGFYGGNSRFEGRDFIIQDATIFHRSTNKMIVNPRQSIRGELRSVGDVISIFQPPIVEVEEFYTGRLIFQ